MTARLSPLGPAGVPLESSAAAAAFGKAAESAPEPAPSSASAASAASTLAFYGREAARMADAYEAIGRKAPGGSPFAALFERWIPAGARVLEVGCGSGRDARLLAKRGAIVTATDGSPEMIREARRLAFVDPNHQAGRLRFEVLSLPPKGPEAIVRLLPQGLDGDARAGRQDGAARENDGESAYTGLPRYAAACALGVLQHLDEGELYQTAVFLDRALDERAGELLIAAPLDHAQDGARRYANRTPDAYAALFERFGFVEAARETAEDAGPEGSRCRWTALVFVRDAGQRRARMNLQSLIENDSKTATYKFALLRALCDVNIANPGRATYEAASPEKAPALALAGAPDAAVGAATVAGVPFSLVLERIVGYYWTALHGRDALAGGSPNGSRSIPPRQISGGRALAFASELEALAGLYGGDWLSFEHDFYGGKLAASPSSPRARAAAALFDAVAATMKKGPVWYAGNSLSALADGASHNVLFRVAGSRGGCPPLSPALAERRYGRLYLPAAVWRELTRVAPQMADAVVLEWAKLSARFGEIASAPEGEAPPCTAGEVLDWLLPPESERDVAAAKAVYSAAIPAGLRCVWTGRPLTAKTLAVDHLVPWSRIHSNDLWNLVPAAARANGNKSDALPTIELMEASADRLCSAWRLMEREKSALFRAQAENAVTGRALPKTHWETPLFDAVLRTTDEVARQFGARRWSGLAL